VSRLSGNNSVTDVKHCAIDFKLYTITDRTLCEPRSLYDVVQDLLEVGVSAIQLREKDLSDTEFIKLAKPIVKLCRTHSTQLFINSRLSIAMKLGVDGVHLPADSPSVRRIKTQTKERLLIGCSVHTLDEARKREYEGTDFVTYSPVYRSAAKPGYGPAVGVENLGEVAAAVKIPVFALGGISPGRISECIGAGAHGVAVMSGVMLPGIGIYQAKAHLRELRDLGGL